MIDEQALEQYKENFATGAFLAIDYLTGEYQKALSFIAKATWGEEFQSCCPGGHQWYTWPASRYFVCCLCKLAIPESLLREVAHDMESQMAAYRTACHKPDLSEFVDSTSDP